jgi:hypothetical protein
MAAELVDAGSVPQTPTSATRRTSSFRAAESPNANTNDSPNTTTSTLIASPNSNDYDHARSRSGSNSEFERLDNSNRRSSSVTVSHDLQTQAGPAVIKITPPPGDRSNGGTSIRFDIAHNSYSDDTDGWENSASPEEENSYGELDWDDEDDDAVSMTDDTSLLNSSVRHSNRERKYQRRIGKGMLGLGRNIERKSALKSKSGEPVRNRPRGSSGSKSAMAATHGTSAHSTLPDNKSDGPRRLNAGRNNSSIPMNVVNGDQIGVYHPFDSMKGVSLSRPIHDHGRNEMRALRTVDEADFDANRTKIQPSVFLWELFIHLFYPFSIFVVLFGERMPAHSLRSRHLWPFTCNGVFLKVFFLGWLPALAFWTMWVCVWLDLEMARKENIIFEVVFASLLYILRATELSIKHAYRSAWFLSRGQVDQLTFFQRQNEELSHGWQEFAPQLIVQEMRLSAHRNHIDLDEMIALRAAPVPAHGLVASASVASATIARTFSDLADWKTDSAILETYASEGNKSPEHSNSSSTEKSSAPRVPPTTHYDELDKHADVQAAGWAGVSCALQVVPYRAGHMRGLSMPLYCVLLELLLRYSSAFHGKSFCLRTSLKWWFQGTTFVSIALLHAAIPMLVRISDEQQAFGSGNVINIAVLCAAFLTTANFSMLLRWFFSGVYSHWRRLDSLHSYGKLLSFGVAEYPEAILLARQVHRASVEVKQHRQTHAERGYRRNSVSVLDTDPTLRLNPMLSSEYPGERLDGFRLRVTPALPGNLLQWMLGYTVLNNLGKAFFCRTSLIVRIVLFSMLPVWVLALVHYAHPFSLDTFVSETTLYSVCALELFLLFVYMMGMHFVRVLGMERRDVLEHVLLQHGMFSQMYDQSSSVQMLRQTTLRNIMHDAMRIVRFEPIPALMFGVKIAESTRLLLTAAAVAVFATLVTAWVQDIEMA